MRLKVVLSVLFLFLNLCAEHISWRSNYDSAHQEALKTDKALMVLLIEKECLACQKMLIETFRDQPYIKELNKKFVSVIVTKGQVGSYPIEMLYTLEYPSVFFLNTRELFIGKNIFGYADADAFKRHLKLHVKF
jgi:thioredoxin-related protein